MSRRGEDGHVVDVVCNQSTPLKGWLCCRTWCSPSIGPRISTWWCSVCCSRIVVDSCHGRELTVGRGSPTLLVGDWS